MRQWGPGTYATYVNLGERFPTFVGIESTESMALEYALSVLADPAECSRRRCCATVIGGESEYLGKAPMGGLDDPAGRQPPPGRTTPIHPVHAGCGASDDCTDSERDLPALTRKEVQWP